MRRSSCFASAFALLLGAAPAAATVNEPNGLVVPRDSANGEVQIYTLFQQRSEPIDWQADAFTTPNAFSPLCGFTATYVLHQSGCSQGLAWYNETGQAPQAGDLHPIVPAGAALGQTFSGTDIKNDPAYAGGLVGFALMANGGCSENHFSNPAYDNVCSACSTPGPWITAMIYASKVTPNAFYVAFEDGGTSASSWANDGDFNDEVFFVTGVTCSGGGQPCDTGKPGICASGVTQCSGTGTTCQQLVQPAAQETCNGLDDDCNGAVDEGALCQAGYVCDRGACVQSCQGGEFSCPASKVCSAAGFCVEPACQSVTCDVGKVCHGGTCSGPCDGVVCPGSAVCRVGACLDPCAGVTCESGQVCDGGVCRTRCDCLPCASGKACDTGSGRCVEPTCAGVSCGAGDHCLNGTCVDDCTGAVCPTGQECKAGGCVDKPAGTGGGGTGGTSIGFGGQGGTGTGTGTGTGGNGTGGNGTGGAGGSGTSGSKSTCGCEVAGEGEGQLGWMAAAALGLLAASRRRRG